MLYRYTATDKDEKVIEGSYEADSLDGVFRYLAGRDLRPVSIKQVKEVTLAVRGLWGGITIADKIFLTKYLALMLKVGTDLLSAIDILITDFDKPSVRNLLLEVRDNLVHGRPFYQAFAKYPRTFSAVFVNLIKAAEASGSLQKTLEDLSESLSKEAELRSRIRAAVIYPIVLLAVAFAIFLFIVIFAVPKVADVFLQSGINPPAFSRAVFSVGIFIGKNTFVILTTLFLTLGFGIFFFWRVRIGRQLVDRFLRKLPIFKQIYSEIAIQRFADTFSSLLRAGIPIVDALRITAEIVGSNEIRMALLRISSEGLSKGLTIGQAFSRETVFPRVVTNLVAISEKAGHLEESLETLADFYSVNINATIKSLMSFLEPALLLLMGLLIGFVVLSMIVPIYQLTSGIAAS